MSGSGISGTLFIVSTPIGNLEDISQRAIDTLSSVDLIAAEDTRTTLNLLRFYKIQKPIVSYYSFNEARRVPEFIERLQSGQSIALVSDAGTPGISDPAFRLTRAALDEGISIVSIPGATAFLPALIASGFSIDHFVFEGFLPVKKGRRTKLESLKNTPHTIVLYESPHRLLRTLRDLDEVIGDREIAIGREMTKKFEEFVRGVPKLVHEHFEQKLPRGEFVIIVAPIQKLESVSETGET